MSSTLFATATLHRFVRYNARQEIMLAIGDMSEIELFGNQLICAPYVHSGILWNEKLGFPPDERLSLERLYALYDSGKAFINQAPAKESIFQGKVMLVVALGDECIRVKTGEWVFTLQENTRQVSIQTPTSQRSRVLKFVTDVDRPGWDCKLCYESDIYGRVDHQDAVV